MEQVLWFLFFSSWCFGICTPIPYYITPEQGECHVNGTELNPCYTLQQLSSEVITVDSVELLLLSGTHSLENRRLSLSNFSKVVIQPLNEDHEVMIQCQLGADLVFYDVLSLKIHSLNVIFCTLYDYYII